MPKNQASYLMIIQIWRSYDVGFQYFIANHKLILYAFMVLIVPFYKVIRNIPYLAIIKESRGSSYVYWANKQSMGVIILHSASCHLMTFDSLS